MRSSRRALIGGVVLLGLGWLAYFKVMAPYYKGQLTEVEGAIQMGQLQLETIEHQVETITELAFQIQDLEYLVEGIQAQLPPFRDESTTLEGLEELLGNFDAVQVRIEPMAEGQLPVEGQPYSTQMFHVSYMSTYEVSREVLQSIEDLWQLVRVENIILERGRTEMDLTVYFGTGEDDGETEPDLLQLMGKETWGKDNKEAGPTDRVDQAVCELQLRSNTEGIRQDKVVGKDPAGELFALNLEGSKELTYTLSVKPEGYTVRLTNESGEQVSRQILGTVGQLRCRVSIAESVEKWKAPVQIVIEENGSIPIVIEAPEVLGDYLTVRTPTGSSVQLGQASEGVEVKAYE